MAETSSHRYRCCEINFVAAAQARIGVELTSRRLRDANSPARASDDRLNDKGICERFPTITPHAVRCKGGATARCNDLLDSWYRVGKRQHEVVRAWSTSGLSGRRGRRF